MIYPRNETNHKHMNFPFIWLVKGTLVVKNFKSIRSIGISLIPTKHQLKIFRHTTPYLNLNVNFFALILRRNFAPGVQNGWPILSPRLSSAFGTFLVLTFIFNLQKEKQYEYRCSYRFLDNFSKVPSHEESLLLFY
jgi:hypothetical protein